MNKKQKGIKLLNPLTVLYLVILLAVVSALFDYKITIVSVLFYSPCLYRENRLYGKYGCFR